MWLLISFIIIWTLSPGPVALMTFHRARKQGLLAGVAVAGGATATTLLLVLMALFLQCVGFSANFAAERMLLVERGGALGIILMGMYAGYKSLLFHSDDTATGKISSGKELPGTKAGFVQGMMVTVAHAPQALLFYNVLVAQTVEPQAIPLAIIILGSLKITLVLGWHAAIAFCATRTLVWNGNKRFGKFFEVTAAGLIVVLGINILI